jgi:hypothetical protein
VTRKRSILATAVLAVTAALTLTSCGTHANGTDPTSGNTQQGTNQHVIKEPHGFRNVAFSCFGPNGVYVTSAGGDDSLPSSVSVVANDPNCPG